ncbi:MAG TPA: MarR family winged helix-turn-helix transcriptional regulator [Aliidongia sp.]|nr:MarR family winged helix-turn-helix transcriptional regulator [Aliidongia sp.]
MNETMLADPRYCNNAMLRQATRRMGQLYDDLLSPTGLRGSQYAILVQIQFMRMPALRPLAEALVMDLSALGHTLKPLIRDGLVDLVVDARDRRVKRARLTADGRAKFEECSKLWQVAQSRFEAAFGLERAAELRSVLGYVSSPEFRDAFVAAATARPS